MSAHPDQRIADIAARQHGNVTRDQCRAAGLGDDAIDHRVARGRLHQRHRGVYAVGHVDQSFRSRAMAAVLAAGPGAVVSHRSAAVLWGLLPEDEGGLIHVTSTTGRPQTTDGVRRHRSRVLALSDTTRRAGVPVTTALRTVLDVAETEDRPTVERALGEAEVQRRVT